MTESLSAYKGNYVSSLVLYSFDEHSAKPWNKVYLDTLKTETQML